MRKHGIVKWYRISIHQRWWKAQKFLKTLASTTPTSLLKTSCLGWGKHPAALEGKEDGPTTMEAIKYAVQFLGPKLAAKVLLEHYNPRCQPPWEERKDSQNVRRHLCPQQWR